VEDSRLIAVGTNQFRRHPPRFGTGVRFVGSEDCTISGCTFRDESDTGQKSGASLLELERCQRFAITGCAFADGAPYAIDATECKDVVITGCTAAETREPAVAKGALRFRGPGSGNRAALNRFSGEIINGPDAELDVE